MIQGWFGSPGALIPVTPYRGSLSESSGRVTSELITLSGRRHLQVGAGSARSWSMSVAGSPAHLAPLKFASTTAMPWVWVSPAAQASNLLTPGQSMMENAGAAIARGALDLGGAWVSQWATGHSSSTTLVTGFHPVPVRPGVTVMVSAYVQRSDPAVPVQMVFQFLDATGVAVAGSTRDSPAGAQLQRGSWPLTPPVGSASLTVMFRYGAVVAAPQVVWGSAPLPYSDGRGVYRVAVTDWSEDQETIQTDGSLWLSASMKMLEVG